MAGELFAIGDLQGCLESLKGLLEQLPKSTHIIFVGDIVNRGPQSLKTLRKVKKLCDSGRAEMVLGNHDLHLLAVAAGAGRVHRKDTIGEILEARDGDELIDWLRKQPLIINTPDTVFVHAGIPPAWTLKDALSHAEEAHRALAGDDWKAYLQGMYGNDNYSDSLSGPARMRAILNGLTRMRFMDPEGNPDYSIKEGLGAAPAGYKPWFECPRRVTKTICFGHWSMLGLMLRPKLIAVDTGCLWGGTLTAVRLSDRRLFQEPCPEWAAPAC